MKNDIIETTRVRLARNYADMPFAAAMDSAQHRRVLERTMSRLGGEFECHEMRSLNKLQKTAFVEAHLMSRELMGSEHGALLLNRDRTMAIMINEEDHVRIQCILAGLALEKADELTAALGNIIAEEGFAFDEELGFLTSCPTNAGTGMRASVMLHLPALSKADAMGSLLETVSKFGFALRGFYGEGTGALGSMYQLSNQVTLGVTEEEIIASMTQAARSIMEKEQIVRETFLQDKGLEFADMVARAVGTLKYARSVQSQEMMKLLSTVKMGVGMDLVKGVELDDISKLIAAAQPATLQLNMAGGMATRDVERADLIRAALLRCEMA